MHFLLLLENLKALNSYQILFRSQLLSVSRVCSAWSRNIILMVSADGAHIGFIGNNRFSYQGNIFVFSPPHIYLLNGNPFTSVSVLLRPPSSLSFSLSPFSPYCCLSLFSFTQFSSNRTWKSSFLPVIPSSFTPHYLVQPLKNMDVNTILTKNH